mmetsp:Transcript_27975/g.109836  ORF Transcript_27975/g.109836 Transcript_27975/m.109836 type:complete len:126 (+) Transcript_27975:607-984(+)
MSYVRFVQVFDALEKKYLETILLEVFAGNPKSVSGSVINDPAQLLEQYRFSVSYPNDMPELTMSQNKNVAGVQPLLGSRGSAPTSSRQQLKESTLAYLETLAVTSASWLIPNLFPPVLEPKYLKA